MFRAKGARVCSGDTLPIFTGLPHCIYRGGTTRYGIIINIGGRQSDRHTVLNFEVYRGSNRNHALARHALLNPGSVHHVPGQQAAGRVNVQPTRLTHRRGQTCGDQYLRERLYLLRR
jgi:hypothetical protein